MEEKSKFIVTCDLKKGVVRMNRPPETVEESLEMEQAVKDAITRDAIAEKSCTIRFLDDVQ